MNTTVRILNLAPSMDASTLEDMFSLVGDVRSARVVEHIGYVEMSSIEEMQNCIHHFNGQQKDGLTLMVREDKPFVPMPKPFKLAGKRVLHVKMKQRKV